MFKRKNDNSSSFNQKDSLRWCNICFRTLHIAGAGALFGGIMLAANHEQLNGWHHLTIVSGLLLLFFEWFHDGNWPHRGKAFLVYFHIICALLIHHLPDAAVPLIWISLALGCIGSHMPRRYRHWSILHGPEKRTIQYD